MKLFNIFRRDIPLMPPDTEESPIEKVITLEERKTTSKLSKNGLCVSEILLLSYCSKGKYPRKNTNYPAFWWYKYGISDVNSVLLELELKGFIEFCSFKNSLLDLTVSSLKDLLKSHNLSSSGKKSELIKRVSNNFTDEELRNVGIDKKYGLTELGKKELLENEYVPYMHSNTKYTDFTVWDLNALLTEENKRDYLSIVQKKHKDLDTHLKESHKASMEIIKEYDPAGYIELKKQDDQLNEIFEAEAKYNEDKDLYAYISFWENIWANDELLFNSQHWMFKLPDLYLKAKKYDEAIDLCNKIKNIGDFNYPEKADKYIQKIKLKMKK